ncbi:hypothetical protein F4803DRAFT_567848 [Xylaria telfairii]|nr:hypothetical protein F4803DRAFT_567848 [Xylaria telfairii]
MPPRGDCPFLATQVGKPAPHIRASATALAYMAGDDSGSTTSSSGLYVSSTSSDGDGSFLWNDIDRLSSITNYSQALAKKKDRRTVSGPLAALRTDNIEHRDVGRDTHLAVWNGENNVYEPDRSFVGKLFDDGHEEIAPEDSISMRDVHREPYEEVASDDECCDDDSICLNTSGKMKKYEDRVTRLGYVERLPDIDGKRHYRIELDIDKLIEEDTVRTQLGTITLSSCELAILNSDGLQPKLASDLEGFNNGFLEVKRSPVSGYGAFAVRDLEPGTTILLERELFNANAFDLYQKLDALTKEQKKAYDNLHGHMRSAAEDIRAAIWRTNRFSIGRGGSVFLVASRFNHACKGRNNVNYSYDKNKKCMVFETKQKVSNGSELFIRYGNGPQHLLSTWGFRCTCGGCAGISEDDCKAIQKSPWDEDQKDDLLSSY